MQFIKNCKSLLKYVPCTRSPKPVTRIVVVKRVHNRLLVTISYRSAFKNSSYSKKMEYFKINSLHQRRKLLDLQFLYNLFNNKIDCSQLLKLFSIIVQHKYPRFECKLL